MGTNKSTLVLIFLICNAFPGCIFSDESVESFDLVIDYSSLNGTIVQKYSDGIIQSTENVMIEFDFSPTKTELLTIGVDVNDGTEPVVSSVSESSLKVVVEFTSHGKYNLSVYAISTNNVKQTLEIPIIIELRIDWTEESTNEPKPLQFDPSPKNGGEHPLMIEIESEVTNPSVLDDFSGGQSVQFSWTVTDELGDTCQRNSAEVSDGASETWETIHFNTYLIHDLTVVYEDGQDLIDVNQTVWIVYGTD